MDQIDKCWIKGLFVFIMAFTICTQSSILAEASKNSDLGVPTLQEAETAYKSATVDVRIKAEVPEGFSGTVTVEYTGKDSEGFTVVLGQESEYMAVIGLPRDLYTYKQHSVVSGYNIRMAKNFLLSEETVNLNDTYLFPIIVSEDSGEDMESDYVTARIYASPQEVDFTGEIEATYSGTNGNSFIVALTAENEYAVELPILADLYTLSDLSVSSGYEVNALYSFNLLDAKSNQKYQMGIKVYEKGASPETPEEKTFVMRQIVFQADIPEAADFTGDIVIAYSGNATYPFQTVLTKEENYIKTVEVPQDTYKLEYAVSYEDLRYTFDCRRTVAVGEGAQHVMVDILQDGKLVKEQAPVAEIDDIVIPEEGKKGNVGSFVAIILFLVAIVSFFLYINLMKKTNGEGKKELTGTGKKEEDFDDYELDEDLEDDEEINLDDF